MSKTIIVTPELVSAFRRYVIEGALPEHCWIWTGAPGPRGYSCLSFKGSTYIASRVSYAIYNGNLDERFIVMHNCDTPFCVNPVHLIQGTNLDNSRDMVEKGRQSKGENRPSSKLTETDVKAIRFKAALGLSSQILAKEYKVSQWNIRAIVARDSWKHVK